MVTRVPALRYFADSLGETFVTCEHFARRMTKAKRPYSTALGRGKRDESLPLEWGVSTLLAIAIGDPKNAAEKVPLIGELRRTDTRFERREVKRSSGTNHLNFKAPYQTIVNDAGSQFSQDKNESVFERLISDAGAVARDWGGERHTDIKRGYEAEINLGPYPWVRVSLMTERDDEVEYWLRHFYTPTPSEARLIEGVHAPLRRRTVIEASHVEMLAALWADTLTLENGAEPNSEPSQADGGKDRNLKSASPTKESAGSPARAPALSDYQSHDDTRANAETTRKDRLPSNSDPIARVCVPSSRIEPEAGLTTSYPRRRTHDPAPQYCSLL